MRALLLILLALRPNQPPLADRIDRLLADKPDVAVAVARDGKIVYARGERHVLPARALTEAAIATLVARGTVRLEDDVTRWLPHLPLQRRVTVGQLLAQTSGLPEASAELTPVERLIRATSQPPAFEPGARREVSSTNDLILGLVVERATGLKLEDAVARLVGVEATSCDGRAVPSGKICATAEGLVRSPRLAMEGVTRRDHADLTVVVLADDPSVRERVAREVLGD